jgi:arsenate reductase-like glutaredoxin family protein
MEPENNNHSIKEKNIMSNEVKQFYEQSQKLYEALKKEKGKIYVKNYEKDSKIKLKTKTICKILEQASLIKKLGSYIIIDETSIEIGYSNELYDDDNGKIFQIIQNRNEFPVIMAKDMDLDNEEKIKK